MSLYRAYHQHVVSYIPDACIALGFLETKWKVVQCRLSYKLSLRYRRACTNVYVPKVFEVFILHRHIPWWFSEEEETHTKI